jgi:hypothetical protein
MHDVVLFVYVSKADGIQVELKKQQVENAECRFFFYLYGFFLPEAKSTKK